MSVTLTNLIPDPLNLTGWDSTPKAWTKTDFEIAGFGGGKVFELTGTTDKKETVVSTTANIPLKSASVYYARWYIYQETTNSAHKTQAYFPVTEPSLSAQLPMKAVGSWQMYSAINTRETFADTSTAKFRIDFDNTYIAGTAYVSAPMLIDLTAAFGKGNEPSKDWCDKHIPFFAGTKTLTTFQMGLVDITPTMTSATAPSGYAVTASSEVTTPRAGWTAFDGISNTYQEEHRWHSAAGLPQWLRMQFPNQRAVTAFSIKNCNDVHMGINAFQLQGSNDGSGWTTIGSYTGVSTLGVETLYAVTKPGLYRYYRLYVTSSHHTTDGTTFYCIVDSVRFFTSGCALNAKKSDSWSTPKEVYAKVDDGWRLVLEANGKSNGSWDT